MKRFISSPIVLFTIFTILLLSQAIFHPDQNLAGGDFKGANVNWLTFSTNELKHGRLPLWNPYVNSGQPYFAHPESRILYPGSIIYFILPIHYAITIVVATSLILGAFFMNKLAYYLVHDSLAAIVAGLTYSFSGFFIARIYAGHLGSIIAAPFYPLFFLATIKAIKKKTFKNIVYATIVFTLLLFSGFPETTAHFSLYTIIFILFVYKKNIMKGFTWKNFQPFIILFAILLLGVLLASIQLLPTIEYVKATTRAQGMPYNEAVIASMSADQLPNLLSRNMYMKNIGISEGYVFIFWEFLNYLGIIAFPLAVYGMLRSISPFAALSIAASIATSIIAVASKYGPWALPTPIPFFQPILIMSFLTIVILSYWLLKGKAKSQSLPLALTILGAASFILSFGNYLPFGLYKWLWQFIPLFKVFRIPSHFLFLTLFSVAVLSAYGMSKIKSKIVKVLLLILVALDFFTFAKPFILTDTSAIYPTDTRLAKAFKTFDKNYRFFHSYGVITGGSDYHHLFNFPNAFSDRVENVKGMDTLILKSFADFGSIIDHRPIVPFSSRSLDVEINNIQSPLLDLLSARYYLTFSHEPNLAQINPSKFRQMATNEKFNLFENKTALHKGTMFYQAKAFLTKDSISKYMSSSSYSSHDELVVDTKTYKQLKPFLETLPNKNPVVKLKSRMPNKTKFTVETPNNGVLLISDISYPGWQANIDGKKTPVYTVNYTLQGIPIPAGNHQVEVFYWPRSLSVGIIISTLTILILAICLWICYYFMLRQN